MFISLVGQLPYRCSQEGCVGKVGSFYDIAVDENGDERVVGVCATCEFASWYIISITQIVSAIGLARDGQNRLDHRFNGLEDE